MKFIHFHAFLEWCEVKMTEWKFASSWALLEGQQSQQMLAEGSRSESTATKKHISGCRRLSFFCHCHFSTFQMKILSQFFPIWFDKFFISKRRLTKGQIATGTSLNIIFLFAFDESRPLTFAKCYSDISITKLRIRASFAPSSHRI